jgi:hypothetical protein
VATGARGTSEPTAKEWPWEDLVGLPTPETGALWLGGQWGPTGPCWHDNL